MAESPGRWRGLTRSCPFGLPATVDEIASAIVFPASGRAFYVSGTILTVDGGRSFRDKWGRAGPPPVLQCSMRTRAGIRDFPRHVHALTW